MAVRQSRIFVPPIQPYDEGDWVSTVVGHVVRPLTDFSGLGWFHFNRYIEPRALSMLDCSELVPPEFEVRGDRGTWVSSPGIDSLRSIRFRYRIDDNKQAEFEDKVRELLTSQGCVADFRGYDHIADYGGSRYLVAGRPDLSADRAELMGEFLCAATRLFLHGLVGPDAQGTFSQEANASSENLLGSRFESVHHLFCNMVDARLPVGITAQSPWMRSATGHLFVLTF